MLPPGRRQNIFSTIQKCENTYFLHLLINLFHRNFISELIIFQCYPGDSLGCIPYQVFEMTYFEENDLLYKKDLISQINVGHDFAITSAPHGKNERNEPPPGRRSRHAIIAYYYQILINEIIS